MEISKTKKKQKILKNGYRVVETLLIAGITTDGVATPFVRDTGTPVGYGIARDDTIVKVNFYPCIGIGNLIIGYGNVGICGIIG